MALDPQLAMLFARLAMTHAPDILKLMSASTVDNPNISGLQELLVNNQYDPGIMQENFDEISKAMAAQHPDSVVNQAMDAEDFLAGKYHGEIMDNLKGRHNELNDILDNLVMPRTDSEYIMTAEGKGPVLNPNTSQQELNRIYDSISAEEARTGLHPDAAKSAIAMLQANPAIGTPSDPNSILFDSYNNEGYTPAPRFEGSPYNAEDLTSDDDPMDAKSKIFRKLVRGY